MIELGILGATGFVAKGLISELARDDDFSLVLYARDPDRAARFLAQEIGGPGNARCVHMDDFGSAKLDVIVNAVGVGDPARVRELGAGIFRLTETFDNWILDDLALQPEALYIAISSGAVYGTGFAEPAGAEARFAISVNAPDPRLHYATAKIHSETKHRAADVLNIVDLRMFSHFSRFIDLSGAFFMAELARCLLAGETFLTNADDMVRDYVGTGDMAQLVRCAIGAWERADGRLNQAVDWYSQAPVGKFELLDHLKAVFSFDYEIAEGAGAQTATGAKSQYFSSYRKAADWGYAPEAGSLEVIEGELRRLADSA